MADSSHLERMGRELKCPICLSLLDSAVSLTCNHVFCNSCIHKSMRSGSNCPVCKVPYQRREIRPAPHMDNLVNIYKSMEVASGLSLFVTQNPPTIKSSDAEKLTEGNLNDESGGKGPETVKCQAEKGIKSKTPSRMKPKISGRSRGKSSFPTNKRVQVPQSPTTETPIRQAMSHCGQSKIITDITDRSSDSPSEHLPSTRNGSPLLPPFFWLREDVDKSSQQTDVDRLTGTPAKAPSFSDIKDSDDDMPSKNSPKDEMLRKCNNGYLLDSEMFEWTQRPCSPELCSTPVKMQVAVQVGNLGEFDGMDIEDMEAPSISAVSSKKEAMRYLDNVSTLEKNINGDCELYNDPSRSKKLHKQSSKARKKTKIMQQKKLMGQVKDALEGSETQAGSIQSPECNHQPAADYSTKNECVGSIYTKSLKEVDDAVASELPASSNNKKNSGEKGKSSNCKRKYERIKQSHRVGSGKQKKQKCDIAKSDTMEEEIIAQDGRHEDTVSKSNSSIRNSVRKPSTIHERTTSCTTHQKSKKGDSQIKYGMENKVIEGDFCQKNMVDGSLDTQLEVVAQAEEEKLEGIPKSKDLGGLQRIGKVHFQKDMLILHKHNAIPIKCAFCHSAEETEASGQMVHYSEGRPVPEDHIAGPVIHSHKNCMEWAPNVYFEHDNAVNLEEELARSRRIKCSLCGEKGAALGCYEKSCRKSFHVPCAKLLQKCRWDTDHFVILCSLHVSSKLPYELSSSQVKKEKSSLKRKFLHRQSQVAVAQSSNTNLWNRDCLRQKLVLCCSGLAYVEKETISEFAKLSGIVISTNWNSSVTHVIASIDENEACKRTIKVLMGILEGKWIVSIKWVQACMKAMRLVDESPYEINHDIHGVNDGPCLGRMRLQNKQPKLFAGFKFYFSGDFVRSYKGYLQDLVTVAGGTVLHRKPIAETDSLAASNSSVTPTVIVYNIELPDQCDLSDKVMILERRRLDAEALARSSGCRVANNSWILNSIAGHKLQDL